MTNLLDEEDADRTLLRIGVVDDEPSEAESIAQSLTVRGFSDVAIVPDAADVVHTFRDFDVLILDLNLGAIDGIDLAERVLSEQPDKWIFVLSGNHSFLTRLDRRELQLKGVFEKPLYPEKMDELVKEADQLARKRQRIVRQVDEVSAALGTAARWAGKDPVAGQRGLAIAKESFRSYFLPTSRMRAAKAGASARRSIVVLIWTALQRLSFVPSEASNLFVPSGPQLEALAECVMVLRGRGLTTDDEDRVDELLWGVNLWPGKGRPMDWDDPLALDPELVFDEVSDSGDSPGAQVS